MTRLAEARIINIVWQEDDDGIVTLDGLQYYEIDFNNELAVFQGDKCVAVHICNSLDHAVAIAEAGEHVCRRNIREGCSHGGYKVTEKGWLVR